MTKNDAKERLATILAMVDSLTTDIRVEFHENDNADFQSLLSDMYSIEEIIEHAMKN